jgi:exodeoxyribonuclease VII large subunit
MRLEGLARGLPDLDRLLGTWNQRLDTAAERLGNAIRGLLRDRGQKVRRWSAQIKAPRQILVESERQLKREARALAGAAQRFLKAKEDRLEAVADRFQPALVARPMRDAAQRLTAMGELLESLSFHRVLDRGYAVVRDAAGRPIAAARSLAGGDMVSIEFADGAVGAQVTGGREAERKPQPSREKKEPRPPNGRQGRLL